MTQSDSLTEILDKYEIIETSHLRHHEHDKENLTQSLQAHIDKLLVEARIDELRRPLLEQASAELAGKRLDIYFLLRTRLDELQEPDRIANLKKG